MFRSKWLGGLQAKMDALTKDDIKKHQPDGEIEDGEKVIGSVPENLRRLRIVQIMMTETARQKEREHKLSHLSPDHKPEDCAKFHEEMAPIGREISAINDLFWLSLESELGVTSGASIGYRSGWEVVSIPEKEEDVSDLVGMTLMSLISR